MGRLGWREQALVGCELCGGGEILWEAATSEDGVVLAVLASFGMDDCTCGGVVKGRQREADDA